MPENDTKPTFTKPGEYDKKISLFKFNKIRINLKGVFDKLSLNQLYIFKYDFANHNVINLMSQEYVKKMGLSPGILTGKVNDIANNNELNTMKSKTLSQDGYLDIFFKDYHNIYDIVSFEFKNIIDYNAEQETNQNRNTIFEILGFKDNCCQSSFSNVVKNIEYYSNEIVEKGVDTETDFNEKSDYILLHSFDISIPNSNSYHRIIYYNEQFTNEKYKEELGSKIDIYVKKIEYVPLDQDDPTFDMNKIQCKNSPNDLFPICENNIDFSSPLEIDKRYVKATKDTILTDYLGKPVIHDVNKIYKYRKYLKLRNVNSDFIILVKFIDLNKVDSNSNSNLDILKINSNSGSNGGESYFAKPLSSIRNFKDVCLLYKNGKEFTAYYLDTNNRVIQFKITNIDTTPNNDYILYEDSQYNKIFYYLSKINHSDWSNGISNNTIKKILCKHNEGCENPGDTPATEIKPIETPEFTVFNESVETITENITNNDLQNKSLTTIVDEVITNVSTNKNIINNKIQIEKYIKPIIEKTIERIIEINPQIPINNPDYLNIDIENLTSQKYDEYLANIDITKVINDVKQKKPVNVTKLDKQNIGVVKVGTHTPSTGESFVNMTSQGFSSYDKFKNTFNSISAFLYTNN
jgi:hypothetical protein